MHRLKYLVAGAICALIGVSAQFAGASLWGGNNPGNNRKAAVESRNSAFNHAVSLYPDPVNSNFPMRKQLVEFDQREDKVNHPWYVYILGQNGNTIGYYVAKFAPENSCNFLSSTEDVYKDGNGNLKMQSPSYDGVYYGSSSCDEWFIFDYSTNALIKFRGMPFYTADAPLKIEASAIKVRRG